MSDLVIKAQSFALQRLSRINQRRASARKSSDVHLKAVAQAVSAVTSDPEVIAAAWLHDVVEDTPATFEAVEQNFGPAVARIVAELTDVSRPTDGDRSVRDAIDRTHASQASVAAKNIKLADLIDTCPDVCTKSPQHARHYLIRAWGLLSVLKEGDAGLFRRGHRTVAEWARKLGIKLPDEETGESWNRGSGPPRGDSTLEARFRRLFVETFTAAEIGEALHSFDLGTPPELLESTMRRLSLPVVGIRSDGAVIGYLSLEDLVLGRPVHRFRPFARRQVLDGSAPLVDVIFVLTRHDYCLISLFDSVVGVISRADIQKPVVRMWLFGIITFFELEIVSRIRQTWPGDSWQERLSPARLDRALALLEERRRRNLPGTLLECLQLADKMQLLLQDRDQREAFGFKTKGAADRVIKDLESLRNNLAHAQDIVTHDWPQIARLAYRILASQDDD